MGTATLDIVPWVPDLGDHGSDGLIVCRGWAPHPSGGLVAQPYISDAFSIKSPWAFSVISGMHVHYWDGDTYVYTALYEDILGTPNGTVRRVEVGSGSAAVPISPFSTQLGLLNGGNPAVKRFTSFGQNVIVAGDKSIPIRFQDSTGVAAFANLITSAAKPGALFCATAGTRLVLASIIHGGTSQTDTGDASATNKNRIWFSGQDAPSYFATPLSSDWDQSKLSETTSLIDDLGEISGLITVPDGYGFIFKPYGVYRFDYNRFPVEYVLIRNSIGTKYPQSIVTDGVYVYYLGTDFVFYRIDASGSVSSISNPISRPFLCSDYLDMGEYPASDPLDPSEKYSIASDIEVAGTFLSEEDFFVWPVGAWDSSTSCIFWLYSVADRDRQNMLVFNTVDGRWSSIDSVPSGGVDASAAIQWAASKPGLGVGYAPENPQSSCYPGRDLVFGLGGTSRYGPAHAWFTDAYGAGIPDQRIIGYPYIQLSDGRSKISGIRPLYSRWVSTTASSEFPAIKVTVRTKESSESGVLTGSVTISSPDIDGWYNFEDMFIGVYHSIIIEFLDSVGGLKPHQTISHLHGFEIDYYEPGS